MLRLKRAFVFLLFFGMLAGPHALGAEVAPQFDLSDVLGSAFPSGMVAGPEGAAFAWIFNERGVRNVWYAEAPNFRAKALTSFAEDDGQDIGQMVFAPDGRSLMFVRGGPPNSRGELPNPRTFVDGVGSQIWHAPIDGDEPKVFGEGYAPFFFDETALGFFKSGDLMKSGLAEYKPEAVLEIRGGQGDLRFSPDRSRLAFVSQRGTHSYIGLLELKTRSVSFLAPSVDSDRSPVWSPDGTQLAFLRVPTGSGGNIFEPLRETDEPWSIQLAEIATETVKQVFHADPGPGSVFVAPVADDAILWAGSAHLIFPWEKTGWNHLYSVALASGAVRELTPGEFEIEFVQPLADGSGAVFSSNQGDIDRRHLWQVKPGDLAAQPLTQGSGIEQAPVPSADGKAIGFLRADGRTPLHPVVRLEDGVEKPLAASLLKGFPTGSMVEPSQVIFRAADGMKIHAQLFEPPATYSGKRPAVVFFHGGSRRHMMLGWHYSSYYHNCYAFNQYMASRGYVVLSVNYRSGIGYGLNFREALDYGAGGATEFNDVLGAGLYLQSRDDVDSDRIGLWGGSYGGYLTALGLARASDLFSAGVDIHGVHDWNRTIKNFVPSYEPLEDPERARLAFESSPLADVERWRSPVLLIHGDDDRNVPFAETIELVDRLRELGVEHELLVFPDEVHGFLLHERWLQVFSHAARFFDQHLGVEAARVAAP